MVRRALLHLCRGFLIGKLLSVTSLIWEFITRVKGNFHKSGSFSRREGFEVETFTLEMVALWSIGLSVMSALDCRGIELWVLSIITAHFKNEVLDRSSKLRF